MSKKDLLISEPPLQVIPSLAVKIGLNEAIALQQLHYWIANHRSPGRDYGGYKWVYNTYENWRETNFPFWSEATIKRTFKNLEKMKVVIARQLDAKGLDMQKFYRIDYKVMEWLKENDVIWDTKTKKFLPDATGQNDPMEQVNMASCTGSNCADVNKNTETNKEPETNDTENNIIDDEKKSLANFSFEKLHTTYKQNIGKVSPLMEEKLKQASTTYPPEWYEPAFLIAEQNNALRWSYIETVLIGWLENGYGWKPDFGYPKPKERAEDIKGDDFADLPEELIPHYQNYVFLTGLTCPQYLYHLQS